MDNNKNFKLRPGVSRDREGNFFGGFFVEDEHGKEERYQYNSVTMVGTAEKFVEMMEKDYKENGFLNFKKLQV